jgi:hypothetical protein
MTRLRSRGANDPGQFELGSFEMLGDLNGVPFLGSARAVSLPISGAASALGDFLRMVPIIRIGRMPGLHCDEPIPITIAYPKSP